MFTFKQVHRGAFCQLPCFLFSGFTSTTVINPLERKLAKRTSVKCSKYKLISTMRDFSTKVKLSIFEIALNYMGSLFFQHKNVALYGVDCDYKLPFIGGQN